jgi:hypothetical protein
MQEERPLRKQADINTNSRAATLPLGCVGGGELLCKKKARSLVMRLLVIYIYFVVYLWKKVINGTKVGLMTH